MAEAVDTRLLDGARAWARSQALFAGVPDPTRPSFFVDAGWYDTVEDEHVGAFCLVRGGSQLEQFVDEVIWLKHGNDVAYLFCAGVSNRVEHDIVLQRSAFFQLAPLSRLQIAVRVRGLL